MGRTVDHIRARALTLPGRLAWHEDAKCATATDLTTDDWFAQQGARAERARNVCLGRDGQPVCPVLDRCFEHALREEQYGVWGGTTEIEREELRARARRARGQQSLVVGA